MSGPVQAQGGGSAHHGKILVLGASGFVGRRLFRRLGAGQAVGTYCAHPFDDGIRFDSATMSLPEIVTDPSEIDFAVVLLGDTEPNSCFADPECSRRINVDGVIRVADQLAAWGIYQVFTSSEFVFDGAKGDYVEEDDANPILLYGHQKLEVERHLAARCDNGSILRVAKVFGDTPGDGTLFTGMIEAIRTQPAIKSAADQRFSPVFVDDVADAILACGRQRMQGLYHLAGPVGVSRMEALEIAVEEMRARFPVQVDLQPCSIRDFPLPEPRPLDVSMRPDKLLRETGLQFRHPRDICRGIVARLAEAG